MFVCVCVRVCVCVYVRVYEIFFQNLESNLKVIKLQSIKIS